MVSAVIFDCEYLTIEGSPTRFWCGPYDPDPTVVQIGAVKLELSDGFEISARKRLYVKPIDRQGRGVEVDPFFSKLTGIMSETVMREGTTLRDILLELDQFADGSRLWSWGKDELNMVAISCYVGGIEAVIPAHRFGNACGLFLKAGMPYAEIQKTRSNSLAAYFGLDAQGLMAHDALDDAMSVALSLQHLLRRGSLSAKDFD